MPAMIRYLDQWATAALALYGKGIDKFELHVYKAYSHTSMLTAVYLAKKESETGIKPDIYVVVYVLSHPSIIESSNEDQP
ncbi:hypothetical protein TNCV_2109631 [Trichonephila clavipes]|nr:hypothetical protein TNCV_2109631 [Trichonephila clavipes]